MIVAGHYQGVDQGVLKYIGDDVAAAAWLDSEGLTVPS